MEENKPTPEQTTKTQEIIRDFFKDYSSAERENLFFDVYCACAVVDDKFGHSDKRKKDILEYLERGKKVLDVAHLLSQSVVPQEDTPNTEKINLEKIESAFETNKEYFNRFFVCGDYCPQQVIENFWKKYDLSKSRKLIFHLELLASYGRDGINMPITTDNLTFSEFRADVTELLNAVYFEHRYNKKRAIKFVQQEDKQRYRNIKKNPE